MSALSGINCFFSKSVCFPRLGVFFFFFSATTFDCVRLLPAHTYLYFVYGFLLRLFYFIYLKKEKKPKTGCTCRAAAGHVTQQQPQGFSPKKKPPQKPKKTLEVYFTRPRGEEPAENR